MARLQFKSSTQRRNFNPVQASTQGLSRMREETNRVVQGMERNAQAEKDLRDRELQAIKDNAEYTERRAAENFKIESANIQREADAANSIANRDQQQAQYDAKAQQTVLDSISNFSTKAAEKAAANTAQQLKDQTDLAMSIDISGSLITQEALTNYNKTKSTQAQGAILETSQIIEDGFSSGATLNDTIKSLVGASGIGSIGRQVLRNRLYAQSYDIILGKAFKSTENNYQLPDGTKFSGVEAYKDPIKLRIVQGEVTRQLSGMMRETFGITDPLYLAEGKTKVEEQNSIRLTQATNLDTESHFAILRQQASEIASGGTYDNYLTAFDTLKKIDGAAAAHDALKEFYVIATPAERLTIESLDLLGKGTPYSEEWSGRTQAMQAAARTRDLKLQGEQDRADKFEYQALEKEAFNDATKQRMTDNPDGVYAEFEAKALEYGQVPSQFVKNAYSAAIKNMADQAEYVLDARTKSLTITKEYIGEIKDPAIRDKAIKLYEEQQLKKFGPDAVRTQKDLEGLADKMTKYGGEGAKGVENGFVLAALRKRYRQLLPDYVAKEAYNKLTEEVAAAPKTAADAVGNKANNIFQSVTTTNNRVTFPKLIADSSDQKARMNAIDRRAISDGASGADAGIPGHVITKEELANLREQAASPLVEFITYPQTTLKFAKRYDLLPSEVVNQAIIGLNKADGGDRPPLTMTPMMQMVDAASPETRELLNSGYTNQQRRGLAQETRQTSSHMRSSFKSGQISGNGYGDLDGQDTGVNIELYGPQGRTGKTSGHQSATGSYGGRGVPISFPYELTYNETIPGGRNAGQKALTTQGSTDRVVKGTAPGGFGHVGSYTYTDKNGDQYEIMMAHGDKPFNSFNEGQTIPAGTVLGYQGASGSSDDGAGGGYDHISLHVNSYGNGDPNRIIREFTNSLLN